MISSIAFRYITTLGPVVYFSGNNGLFTDLLMMDKRSKHDEIDLEELLEQHLIQYFSEHKYQYIYYKIGGEDSNCQLNVIKGTIDGHITFNYKTEFSDFSNDCTVMEGSGYNDLIMISPNNVDIFYDGIQKLKTIKLKISFEKNKKMKKVNIRKDRE